MDVREVPLEGMDWIHQTGDSYQCRAVVSTIMNLRVP